MDLEDLALRYREIPLKIRIPVLCLLAIAPGAYDLYDRLDPVNAALQTAYADKAVEEGKLKEALEKHQKLSKVQEELASYELLVKEATKKLPDSIFMDQILQKTELLAEDMGLALKNFRPGKEISSETAFRYIRLPIHLDIVGTYGQIAAFFDRIAHLEVIIHIEDVNLTVEGSMGGNEQGKLIFTGDKADQKRRSQTRLRASCEMMVFRTLTEAESASSQAVYLEKRKAERPPEPPPSNNTSSKLENALK